MAFLSGSWCSMLSAMAMAMAMAMAVFMEKQEAKDIGEKATRSNAQDKQGVRDRLRFGETLNSLKEDG